MIGCQGTIKHEANRVPTYTFDECLGPAIRRLARLVRGTPSGGAPPKITYEEMAKYITWTLNRRRVKVNRRNVGPIVGRMMDRIWEEVEDVPPVNMLVINGGKSAAPGKGAGSYAEKWLGKKAGWYKSLDDSGKQSAVQTVWLDIRRYRHWERIATYFDSAASIRKSLQEEGLNESDGKELRRFGVGPPESAEHKRLKQFILDNPTIAGARYRIAHRQVEYRFPTLDEADVYFAGKKCTHFVEVKSRVSREPDLLRGLFQCVKYRAIGDAMERAGIQGGYDRRVAVTLVIERTNLPRRIRSLSTIFDVPLVPISPKRVDRWSRERGLT
jgi:hypothetical protein